MGDTARRKIEIDEIWSEEHADALSFMDIHLGACKTHQSRREIMIGIQRFRSGFSPKGQVELASFHRKQSTM